MKTVSMGLQQHIEWLVAIGTVCGQFGGVKIEPRDIDVDQRTITFPTGDVWHPGDTLAGTTNEPPHGACYFVPPAVNISIQNHITSPYSSCVEDSYCSPHVCHIFLDSAISRLSSWVGATHKHKTHALVTGHKQQHSSPLFNSMQATCGGLHKVVIFLNMNLTPSI
jgi:hypothetical protein